MASGNEEWCHSWPEAGDGGMGGGGGHGGADAGGAGGAGGVPPCPNGAELLGCGYVIEALGFQDGECCYILDANDCPGRPYLDHGEALAAAPARGGEQPWARFPGHAPEIEGLSAAIRKELAEAWTRDGLYEHASVASFSRCALELMAVGAPPDLVAASQRAALDEVRHARACLALASAYAGEPIGPGRFPVDGPVRVSSNLADVAAGAVLEGCVGETIAALQAVEQQAAARDPAVRDVLGMIGRDEARHAELAWKTVAWALAQGGERVRKTVTKAFAHAIAVQLAASKRPEATPADAVLTEHGRLDGPAIAALRRRAIEEVIGPCARGLLSHWGQRPTAETKPTLPGEALAGS